MACMWSIPSLLCIGREVECARCTSQHCTLRTLCMNETSFTLRRISFPHPPSPLKHHLSFTFSAWEVSVLCAKGSMVTSSGTLFAKSSLTYASSPPQHTATNVVIARTVPSLLLRTKPQHTRCCSAVLLLSSAVEMLCCAASLPCCCSLLCCYFSAVLLLCCATAAASLLMLCCYRVPPRRRSQSCSDR
jgi:hypothetical protein